MCTTSFTPPSLEKYYFASVRGLAIVANAHAWLQELYFWQTSRLAFLRSVVIFVKYREVSTRTISPNFIGNCRNSFVFAFWRPQRGGAVKGEGRVCASLVWFSWPTKAILQGNQKGPCVQAHAFATITMYSWWRFSETAYRAK
jgi:hypothetical protein